MMELKKLGSTAAANTGLLLFLAACPAVGASADVSSAFVLGLSVVVLGIMWDVGRFASIGFLGTFKTNDLLMTVGMVQVINMLSSLARFFVSIPFGKFSDKTSFATGIKVALVIVAIGFGFNIAVSKIFKGNFKLFG